jgi:hypothetical protein
MVLAAVERGSRREEWEVAAPIITMTRPVAARGVRTRAVSVSQGAKRPATARSSQMATQRTSGIGNGAMPVWPVVMRRVRDMVAFRTPEIVKTTASVPVKIQVIVFMSIADDRQSDPVTIDRTVTGKSGRSSVKV